MKRFLLMLENAVVVFLAISIAVSPATSFGAPQSTKPSPPSEWEPYVVKPGDHLGVVLFDRGIGPLWGRNAWVERARRANGMTSRYDLEVGASVYLPKANSVGWVEPAGARGPREKRTTAGTTAGTKSIVRRSLAQASAPISSAESEEPVAEPTEARPLKAEPPLLLLLDRPLKLRD
jgi:hypothetical protein